MKTRDRSIFKAEPHIFNTFFVAIFWAVQDTEIVKFVDFVI